MLPVVATREIICGGMSSRPLVIAGFVGGVVAGVALFAGALALVAMGGDGMSGPMMALLVLGTMLGFVLDATWLTLALGRLTGDGPGDGEDGDGGNGWGSPGSDPPRPRPPSDEPDWWPEFERELTEYLKVRERPRIPR